MDLTKTALDLTKPIQKGPISRTARRTMVADKRKVLDDDSDDDFAPSAEASPVEKPSKKKSKPKAPKAKPETDGGAPKEKKQKQEANLDYGVDITQYDQSPELTEKYSAMSVTELNQWLKANRVVKGPANKANLVARCVDGELFGAIPPCPRCVTGKLKVAYPSLDAHGGQGDWTCRGSFDESIGIRVKCYFTARPGEVTRLPWRDLHDPAPEPEKPGAPKGASVAEAEFPPGFESFAGKDAAAAVNDIATALGFQLPAEGARSEIGAQLLATRNADGKWDGAAALKALRELYPPLTAEEAAGGPPAKHPDNSALASCLDHLVRLETKHKEADAFKLRAYKSAAMEIRDLDYAITSGKACAKAGPTKVKGVGKGLAEKIDEFLKTGTMARITELERRTNAPA